MEAIKDWIKDNATGHIVAPRTLLECVQKRDGKPLSDIVCMSNDQSVIEGYSVVESPFRFDVQDGVYGYIKKDEQGADTFCPFSGGVKIDTQYKTTYDESGTVTDGATFEFDFDVKMFLILMMTNNILPFSTNSPNVIAGYLDNGTLKIAGKIKDTSPTQSFHCYMPTSKSINVKDSTNKKNVFCIAFSEIVDSLLPCINGLPTTQNEE